MPEFQADSQLIWMLGLPFILLLCAGLMLLAYMWWQRLELDLALRESDFGLGGDTSFHPPLHWSDRIAPDEPVPEDHSDIFTYVALPSFTAKPLDGEAMARLLARRFPRLMPHVEITGSGPGGMMMIAASGRLFGLMQRAERFMEAVPQEREEAIRRSYHWPRARDMLSRQQGHFMLVPLGEAPGSAEERLHCAKLLTALAAAVIELHQIAGVYWSHTGNFHAADFWHRESMALEAPPRMATGSLPYKLWLDIRLLPQGGGISIAGLGLLRDRETGVMPAAVIGSAAAAAASDFMSELLRRGPVVDGDAVLRAGGPKIELRFSSECHPLGRA
jgi:hypothetical protein